MSQNTPSESLPPFVSRQVTEARRFFLNLDPSRQAALEVVCGGVERMRAEYVIDRKDFPYFAVELVAEGEGVLAISGEKYALSAGSLFAYGPRVPHTIRNRADNPMRKYYLDFVGTRAAKLLQSAGLRTGAKRYSAIAVGGLHELTDIFEMLIREASETGPIASSISESLTQLLFLKIQQLRLPKGSSMPRAYTTYERVRRYIEENYLVLDTAQDVADQCEITSVYLSRLFSRFADCGAYQFLLQRKMNYAAGLLMNEGLLVKDVAMKLGFADPFQFSRSFKRVYGIPPTRLVSTGQ
ncbi:AraC family transcriptional regulator [Thalassoroseus pseudoceratinae]|uniref:AraC family transcriptional regulator n=1 Tax=Thalassoroseus pseudoceratinae TaxID=2713176 RepID=UPI0014240E8D|nr:AraC family transcriptional regulator [Thalassoroseus pseudoceratinae]